MNPRFVIGVTKASVKKCGIIKSYAANLNQGIIRDYNEDRVSIILNIMKPKSKAHLDINWPQISFLEFLMVMEEQFVQISLEITCITMLSRASIFLRIQGESYLARIQRV